MMMNHFGTPMTEADINMSANPAKTMLKQQLATGINNVFDPVSATIAAVGTGLGIIGGSKSASAAKKNAETQNQQTNKQFKYDKELYKQKKQQLKSKHAFTIDQIKTQAKNEKKLAQYQDKTNQQQYEYQLQIAEAEEELQQKMYKQSEETYKQQLKINALEESEALQSQYQQLDEIATENRYQTQDLLTDTLIAEGQVRALGQVGNSAAKRASSQALDAANKLTLLDLSLQNATLASQMSVRNIRLARTIADLNAEADKMLEPGQIPKPPKPIATPTAKYIFPPVLQAFDFGPKPIKGAMASPSAAANAAWGAALPGIASTATSGFLKAFE